MKSSSDSETEQADRIGNTDWCQCSQSICCQEKKQVPDDFFEGKTIISFEFFNINEFLIEL